MLTPLFSVVINIPFSVIKLKGLGPFKGGDMLDTTLQSTGAPIEVALQADGSGAPYARLLSPPVPFVS